MDGDTTDGMVRIVVDESNEGSFDGLRDGLTESIGGEVFDGTNDGLSDGEDDWGDRRVEQWNIYWNC